MGNVVRIALLSDLHPADSSNDGGGKSHLDMNGPDSPEQNPVAGLRKLAEEERLKANIVICPGDIGNKGNPKTIEYGWNKLHHIKDFFRAERVIAVPGNHDHDSRSLYNDFDPKYILQNLEPSFPSSDFNENTHFWAWHWSFCEFGSCRILSINSSAFHGLKDEFKHGRVSPISIGNIKKKLDSLPKANNKLNILVCHHHPHKQEDIELEDYEAMDGGQRLIKILDDSNNPWIIIHGHKHFPHISYAQGSSSSPIVFSAGSFSAHLDPKVATRVTNQFHYLEFYIDKFDEMGGCVGRFKTYDWSYGIGWQKSGHKGLPANGGFGYRISPKLMAKNVSKVLGEKTYLTKSEAIKELPELDYLSPADLETLKDVLITDYNIELEMKDGIIDQIGKLQL